MSDNVTSIFKAEEELLREGRERRERQQQEANQDCIKALEEALKLAKMGTMVTISINWVYGEWVRIEDKDHSPSPLSAFIPLHGDGLDAGMGGAFTVPLIGTMKAAAADIFQRALEKTRCED